ncbi:PTS system mannose/fructose/N-acetylgalactosamine-transporter subunit IIB [Enterococcus sp. DIV0240d]|uniref:PTS system mannose/fructose/N-acetylgalactosamine-transporter subunit IIB n=1 Tax=Enterococcus sp. DIV0240d TaxID=2774717 RepID=UPI003F68361E
MIRLDDRLIHGQVAVMWTKRLGVERIIVASDEAAANELQSNALKMAAPSSVKVFIMPIDKVTKIINDERSKSKKILIVTDTPGKIQRLVNQIDEKPEINIANYGRVAGSIGDKIKVTDTVYITEEDKTILHDMMAEEYEITYQPLPEDSKIMLKKLMKEDV